MPGPGKRKAIIREDTTNKVYNTEISDNGTRKNVTAQTAYGRGEFKRKFNVRSKQEIEGFKKNETGRYDSGAAPRVGGPASNTQGGVPTGGTKKQVYKSKMRVKKTAASPQAKSAARKIYRKS